MEMHCVDMWLKHVRGGDVDPIIQQARTHHVPPSPLFPSLTSPLLLLWLRLSTRTSHLYYHPLPLLISVLIPLSPLLVFSVLRGSTYLSRLQRGFPQSVIILHNVTYAGRDAKDTCAVLHRSLT